MNQREYIKEVKPFNPPVWMQNIAKETVARMAPGMLTKRMQEAKDQDKTNKNAAMQAFAKTLTEVQREHDVSHSKIAKRAEVVGEREAIERMQPAAQPDVAKQLRLLKQTKPARTLSQLHLRDERRLNKEKVRTQKAEAQREESSTSRRASAAEDSASLSTTESFTTNTIRDPKRVTERIDLMQSQSLFVLDSVKEKYPLRPALPKWYTMISESTYMMKELGKKRPQSLTALEALKACAARCEIEKRSQQLINLYEELRDHLHKAEIALQVDKFILKKARILSNETGLPTIFREDAQFPGDVKADAYQLYVRWYKEDFEQDILRGIVTSKGKDRNGDRIDRTYRAKYPNSARFYGEGNLVLGQWWPTQLCTVRDGAHGASQGGIFGEKDKGAYSIVLSGGNKYHDQDNGDTIEYSGTEGKDGIPTENTSHLIHSMDLGNPIRVIRSAQLHKKNKYRPELGFRYDGLYEVKGYKLVDADKAIYRFALQRCENQEPIRCEKNAARRPTIFEVREYDKLREKVW